MGGRGEVSGVGFRVWEGRARVRGGGAGGEESEKATGDGDITRELSRYVAERSDEGRAVGRGGRLHARARVWRAEGELEEVEGFEDARGGT